MSSVQSASSGGEAAITVPQVKTGCWNPGCDKVHDVYLSCGNCRTAKYGDKDCQTAHWKAHKLECKALAISQFEKTAKVALEADKAIINKAHQIATSGLPKRVENKLSSELLLSHMESIKRELEGQLEAWKETERLVKKGNRKTDKALDLAQKIAKNSKPKVS